VLGSLPAGIATLVVSAVGYRAAREAVDLLPGIELDRTLRLVALPAVLPDIDVQAMPASATLGHEALVRRGSDLASAIDGWQGVVVRRSGGNGPASPQVRGSAPEEVLVVLDGFAINDPLTGRADLSRVPTRDVASVRVAPGAQSSGASGTALGGVIYVESQPSARSDGSAWVGSHGSGGGSLAGTVGQSRVFVRGERLPDDFAYTVPPNRGGGEALRQNAGGTIGSLSVRRPGALAVQARASASKRGLPGSVGNETPTASAQDLAAFLGLTLTRGSTWNGSLQYLRSDVTDATPPAGPAYDVRSEGVSGTLDWSDTRAFRFAGWDGSVELGAGARHDQYSGDVVRDGTQFTRGGVRATATLRPPGEASLSFTPSVRLDAWTGESGPLVSARLDAGWQGPSTAVHASVGSAVAAPPLADLFFREGVGVALNPGLRPERVRWEVELGLDQDWRLLGRPARASVRGYYGMVEDLILWAPGIGFIWSPRNYDVVRRGVDAALSVQPFQSVTLEAQGAWTPVTYDVPGGAQVQYRPRATWGATAAWMGGAWRADSRWRWVGERYPNPGGVNPRPAFGVLDIGVERALGAAVVRADVRDLLDARPEFLAGYPTPGRTAILSVSLEWQ
jgi:iron complex outermembrane receptor protein